MEYSKKAPQVDEWQVVQPNDICLRADYASRIMRLEEKQESQILKPNPLLKDIEDRALLVLQDLRRWNRRLPTWLEKT